MRKLFTFLCAALMSVGMFGATVQENKSLDASVWWGWNSSHKNVESKLEGTITGAYGAIGTSFENALERMEQTGRCSGQHRRLRR